LDEPRNDSLRKRENPDVGVGGSFDAAFGAAIGLTAFLRPLREKTGDLGSTFGERISSGQIEGPTGMLIVDRRGAEEGRFPGSARGLSVD
jgi:hypothetical protein